MKTFDDDQLHLILGDECIEGLYRDLEKYIDNSVYLGILNLVVRQVREQQKELDKYLLNKEKDNG